MKTKKFLLTLLAALSSASLSAQPTPAQPREATVAEMASGSPNNGGLYVSPRRMSGGSGPGVFTSVTDSGLTSGRVVFVSTGGLLADAAALTWNGTTLGVNSITAATSTALTLNAGATGNNGINLNPTGTGSIVATQANGYTFFKGGQFFIGGSAMNVAPHTNLLMKIGDNNTAEPDWSPANGSTTAYGMHFGPTIELVGGNYSPVVGISLGLNMADDGTPRTASDAYALYVRTGAKTADVTVTAAYGIRVDPPTYGVTNTSLLVNGVSLFTDTTSASSAVTVSSTGTNTATALVVTRSGATSGLIKGIDVAADGTAGAANTQGIVVSASGGSSSNKAILGGAGIWQQNDATDATSSNGSVYTAGGASIQKKVYVGTNLTVAGAVITTPDALSGPGAVSVTTSSTEVTTTGVADALTLANGTNGQIKVIVHGVDGGSFVLTPSTKTGWSTFTSTAAGESITVQYFTTRGWIVIGSYLGVIAP